MKTMIAIPAMEQMYSWTAQCLANLRHVGECKTEYIVRMQVDMARNVLAQRAVEGGYDRILWIDSDMTFEPDMMERMFDSIGDKECLSALCFSRRPPFNPCVYKEVTVVRDGAGLMPKVVNYFDYPRDSLIEVAGFGWACVLQRTDMMKTVMDTFPVPFFPMGGLGEDLAYCYRAAQLGAKFYIDTSIKIGHLMRMSVDESFVDNVFQGL